MKGTSIITQSRLKWVFLIILVFPLILLAGTNSKASNVSCGTYEVRVSSGYLALRSAPAYDSSNEKGALYTGERVEVVQPTSTAYAYVYAPKFGLYGYVNADYLIPVNYSYSYESYSTMTVSVASGYLALRSWKEYNYANEIGKLYSGDTVEVLDASDYRYWYVYAPKLRNYGYVDCNYLYGDQSWRYQYPSYDTMTVSVASGYLALRTWKEYNSANEIGKLYTGDIVQVIDTGDSTYWYVYVPKLGKYGYVDRRYIFGSVAYTTYPRWTVRVSSGYLALRTEKAYDSSNEIGKLYSGEVVEAIDTSDPSYWYVYSYKLGLYGYVNSNYLY